MKRCLRAIDLVGPDAHLSPDTIDQLSSDGFDLSPESVQFVIGSIVSAFASTVDQKRCFTAQLLDCAKYCKAVADKSKAKVGVDNLRSISWISWIASISQSREDATQSDFRDLHNSCLLKVEGSLYALSLDKKVVCCLIEL